MTEQPEMSTRKVLEAIARHLGVDVGQLKGRERTAATALARRVAISLLRDRCRSPYRQIGAMLGRSHGTIVEVYQGARDRPHTTDLVEHVGRMLDEEQPRTRATHDVEETLRRAREDAGLATRPRGRPR